MGALGKGWTVRPSRSTGNVLQTSFQSPPPRGAGDCLEASCTPSLGSGGRGVRFSLPSAARRLRERLRLVLSYSALHPHPHPLISLVSWPLSLIQQGLWHWPRLYSPHSLTSCHSPRRLRHPAVPYLLSSRCTLRVPSISLCHPHPTTACPRPCHQPKGLHPRNLLIVTSLPAVLLIHFNYDISATFWGPLVHWPLPVGPLIGPQY